MSAWVVMEIGCIECGEESKIVGIFDSQEKAKSVAENHKPSPKYSGEIRVQIFECNEEI